MDYTHATHPIPAASLDDAQLRRELAELHRIESAVKRHCPPGRHRALRERLSELDGEYLRRFPTARDRWPWRVWDPVQEDAMP